MDCFVIKKYKDLAEAKPLYKMLTFRKSPPPPGGDFHAGWEYDRNP